MRREIPRLRLEGQLPTGLIIDARSESEFAADHIPGAINLPTLNDQERIEVGTLYKQASPFKARIRGASLAARNIADHVEHSLSGLPQGHPMWVYCWRGGQRSGSLALVLKEIGFSPKLINGGYKHWRNEVMSGLPRRIESLKWRVLSGPTGVGKTRWLQALAEAGEPTLDLEGLGGHRGSLLGDVNGGQPTQRAFESRLYHHLSSLESGTEVWVESESANLGKLTIPAALMTKIHAAPQVELQVSLADRVAQLLKDYPMWVDAPDQLIEKLNVLRPRHSNARIDQWITWIHQSNFEALVSDLLIHHYDPTYAHGAKRLNQSDRTEVCVGSTQDTLSQLIKMRKSD
ncbi:MAG: tRNA 2-selenouridine(34) synthase MnmH [Pseudomonadales bacterium]|jgi:tRNA 2-selenouridine synthase